MAFDRGSTIAPLAHSDSHPGAPHLRYLPGLDGLRALAVVAVFAYHANLPWAPGGFLGVEVFFALSGYLITALLLEEWRRDGQIDLVGFWVRRARRLLPALLLLLAVVGAGSALLLPGARDRVGRELLAALGYVTNWQLILTEGSYFSTIERPSPLRHLWSLAVEEQFYLLWPIALRAMLRRWPRSTVTLATITGAAASAALMAALHQPGADPLRVYYGTDTRAAGFLLGAALALLWSPQQSTKLPPRLADGLGIVALGCLIWSAVRVTEFMPLLYSGGFALIALLTAVVIVAATHPRASLMAALLELGPLRWVGVRSYAIYLWHWPILALSRPFLDVPFGGAALLILQAAATLLLADLSYRYVELPLRHGRPPAWLRHWMERLAPARRWAGPLVLGVAVLALAIAVFRRQADVPQTFAATRLLPTAEVRAPTPVTVVRIVPIGMPTLRAPPGFVTPTPSPLPTITPTPSPVPIGPVTAIGDSVMLGASGALAEAVDAIEIDAAVSRHTASVIEILHGRAAAGTLAETVLLHTGNNGPIGAEEFDALMAAAGDRTVLLVTIKVPRWWEGPNNAVLAEGASRYPNAHLVDWYGASVNRPELFAGDGYHLTGDGAALYASLVLAALHETR